VEPRRVLIVGLGTIAQTHLDVLSRRHDVTLMGGIDPIADDPRLPVYRSVDEALVAVPDPDLVVVATPTPTHVAVVLEILDRSNALVLSEKPLATLVHEVDALSRAADRVRVAHHFAFSPEVEWARRHVTARGWTRPIRVVSSFNDAYSGLSASRQASLVSSWVDSGPNQISLLAPFTGAHTLVCHTQDRHRAVTVLAHDGGHSVLTSNWLAADSSKQTSLAYDGDREVRLDHTSLTATVLEEGVVSHHVGYTDSPDRKQAHYIGLYNVLFTDPYDARLGVPLARQIAGLLEGSAHAPTPSTPVTWAGIGADPTP
jgi:predicted dehydrogenase